MNGEGPIASGDLGALFSRLERYEHLVLAVSGGADSVALLHLVTEWARGRERAPGVSAATVDHGLRAESADEAAWVGARSAELGVTHETLRWTGEKPVSGVQAKARAARYRLLGEHARSLGRRGAIVTAHHRDDQVETLLMRLGRGSGLDGLSGMRTGSNAPFPGSLPIERPFLDTAKARLLATVTARGLAWLEDPSNADERFERVRLRRASAALADLSLSEEGMARSVRRLARARDALDAATRSLLREAVRLNGGAYAVIQRRLFDSHPEELRIRVLGLLLAAYGGQEELARLSDIERLADALALGGASSRTLSGCIIVQTADCLEIFREPGREGLPEARLGSKPVIWDRRFLAATRLNRPDEVSVRALGHEGYAALCRRLASNVSVPHRAGVTLPSFWRGETLLAAPHLAWPTGIAGHAFEVRFLFEADPSHDALSEH